MQLQAPQVTRGQPHTHHNANNTNRYWQKHPKAQVVILGLGGAGTAIAAHLVNAIGCSLAPVVPTPKLSASLASVKYLPASRRPAAIHLVDVDPAQLQRFKVSQHNLNHAATRLPHSQAAFTRTPWHVLAASQRCQRPSYCTLVLHRAGLKTRALTLTPPSSFTRRPATQHTHL